jgi:hypothetical protein
VIALFWFLNKTRTGKSMRAYSDNRDLALLSGINPDKVVMVAWILTAALATIAGTLYGLDKSFKPFTYLQLLLPIFAAAIVGGLGNPLGAIAGGFIVALSEVFITFAYTRFLALILPEGGRLTGWCSSCPPTTSSRSRSPSWSSCCWSGQPASSGGNRYDHQLAQRFHVCRHGRACCCLSAFSRAGRCRSPSSTCA